MKLFIILSLALLSFNAQAAKKSAFKREYGLAGCGLGSVIVGKQGGQVFAATTNGTSYNQSLGITFGTLNCVDGPVAEVAGNLDKFIIANRTSLQIDVVKGQGETLAAVHQILGCQVDETAFNSTLKSNYKKIFSSQELKANELSDNLINVIQSNDELSKKCQLG